jgi:hypothetical protein
MRGIFVIRPLRSDVSFNDKIEQVGMVDMT